MIISDKIYGDIQIHVSVITDLISTRALWRLKGVDQAGYYEPYLPGTKHSRYEHSVGVYYLLNRFGASVPEQVAGLIHDVSHTVFSHCIDYALDEGSESRQNHQDNSHYTYVMGSDIPAVLAKHGMDTGFILDDRNFPLKERELPDICADRLDYSLRTAVMYGEITPVEAEWYLRHLVIKDRQWVFDSYDSAGRFAQLFKLLNDKYYSGLPSAIMFRTVGDAVRFALKNQYITRENLYATDDVVLTRMREAARANWEMQRLLDRMDGKITCRRVEKDGNAVVTVKSRAVDPLFRDLSRVSRVSVFDQTWAQTVREECQPKTYFLEFAE